MNRTLRNAVTLALVHGALVAAVGAAAYVDRERLPRGVVRVVAAETNPVQGRYLTAHLLLDVPEGWKAPEAAKPGEFTPHPRLNLSLRDGRVVAVPGRAFGAEARQESADDGKGQVTRLRVMLPVRLYLGPGTRAAVKPGEPLWMEVSLPPSGLPRPIALVRM